MENAMITYKDDSMTELEAIRLISEGAALKDFAPQTKLMCLATITYQKDGWKQIPETYWNKRLAALAVNRDFRALLVIPEFFYPSCVAEFARWGNKLTASDEEEWKNMLNMQSEVFIKKVISNYPRLERYIEEKNKTVAVVMTAKDNEFKEHAFVEKAPVLPEDAFEYSFQEDREVMDPEGFFTLSHEERTLEKLKGLLDSDALFPPDFIERLSLPNKNAYYYEKSGDTKMKEFWDSQKLPYLNKKICMEIALKHPEGSIKTSSYITKEGVMAFFEKYSTILSPVIMTTYFMSFPPETLDGSMAKSIKMSWNVLAHAPEALCDTEEADKYLKKYPWDVLKLPECYQTADRLITAGVKLSRDNLKYIKNDEMREKIDLALNISRNRKQK